MNDMIDLGSSSTHIVFRDQFRDQGYEEEVFHQDDLVKLLPYGLSVATDASRPFLLFKDESHQYTLPVAVSPIDAGVALSQSNKMTLESSPHKFTALLLQSMKIEIKQAVFVEIKGSHQYVRLYLSGNPQMSSLKMRADEAMSMCLYMQVPIFASKSYIARSKVMTAEPMSSAQKNSNFNSIDKGAGYLN